MNEFIQGLEGYLQRVLAALGLLVLGWLLARLAAAVASKALRRTALDRRLASWIGQEEEADRVTHWASRMVHYLILLLVIVAVLRRLILPIAAQPAKRLMDQMLVYVQMFLDASPIAFPVEVLLTLIVTAVLVLVLRVISQVFPKVYARLDSWRGTRIRSLYIQRVEILPADRITNILIALVKYIRVAAVLVILYFYISLVFSFFPRPRDLQQNSLATLFQHSMWFGNRLSPTCRTCS